MLVSWQFIHVGLPTCWRWEVSWLGLADQVWNYFDRWGLGVLWFKYSAWPYLTPSSSVRNYETYRYTLSHLHLIWLDYLAEHHTSDLISSLWWHYFPKYIETTKLLYITYCEGCPRTPSVVQCPSMDSPDTLDILRLSMDNQGVYSN